MTINCLRNHTTWIKEYEGDIWICEICIAKKDAIQSARGILLLAKAKALWQEENPIEAAGGTHAYLLKLAKAA